MEQGRLNHEKDLFFKQKHIKVALEENYKDQFRKNWKNKWKSRKGTWNHKYAEVGDTVALDQNIHMQEADQCSTFFSIHV